MNDLLDQRESLQQATTSARLGPAKIVGGCYILFQCIGQSPRSSVWTCRHKDLDGGLLAIRILNPEISSDQNACARFHREVVASYTVNHPNVVRTHEFINDGKHVAYTMEFMEYGNLKTLLDTGEPLSIEDVILIAARVAAGLEGVHQAGLIHRNLKPGNVFFSEEGEIKIADFAIARADSGRKLTNDGEVLGTVGYTSPEYLTTGEVDYRSDIYALGLLMYEMITGNYPYYSPNPVEAIRLRVTTDPISPTEIRFECPLELSSIVARAMARNPEDRYQSAGELRIELESLRVAASVNSKTQEFRNRRKSFWTHIPEPYVNLGVGHTGKEASKIFTLRESVSVDLGRRRILFSVIVTSLFGLLGVLLAIAMFHTDGGKNTLAEVEKKLEATRKKVLTSFHPSSSPTIAPAAPGSVSYRVQPGDTLSGIAVKFGISAKAIMDANGIEDPRKLAVGTSLTIPN